MHFLYASLLSANFFMYTVAFLLIRPSVYLLSLPSGVVMPTIVMLCLVGTFAASYSTFDVAVMFISGAIGYLLYRGGYPFAPLILGLILGPMADENLRARFIFSTENTTRCCTGRSGSSCSSR